MAVRQMLVAGRYRLLEPVGAGGMGRVWLARDEMLHRDVAVKEIVPPDWMTGAEQDRLRERTLREARSAARLNHPHVVRIYDVVHAAGLSWIVMEYVPSRSLHQVLYEDGPYEPAEAARIGLAVLDALAAAHRAGVLHRDVKPHNVLIGTDGRVVLTDFGLATFVDDGSVTAPGLIVGSPQYVSPERARDGASTVESDLWSLGATLYAAVEGRSPYARETAMATLAALATEPPDPPVRAGPLTSVLDGLLRYEPATRLTVPEIERRLRMIVFEDPREKIPFLPGQRAGRRGRTREPTRAGFTPEPEPASSHTGAPVSPASSPAAVPVSPARPHRGTATVTGRLSPLPPPKVSPDPGTSTGRPRPSPGPARRAAGVAPVPSAPPDATRMPPPPPESPVAPGLTPAPAAPVHAEQHPYLKGDGPPSPDRHDESVPPHAEGSPEPGRLDPVEPDTETRPGPPRTETTTEGAHRSPGSTSTHAFDGAPIASASSAPAGPSPLAGESDPSRFGPPPADSTARETATTDPKAGSTEPGKTAGTEVERWHQPVPSEPAATAMSSPDGQPLGDRPGNEATDPLPPAPPEPETTRLTPPVSQAVVVRAASGQTSTPNPTRSVRVSQARLTVTVLVLLVLGGSLFAGYLADRSDPRPQVFLPAPPSATESLVTVTPSPTVAAPVSAPPSEGPKSPVESSPGPIAPPAGSLGFSEPTSSGSPTISPSSTVTAFAPVLCDEPPPAGLPATPRKGATRGVNGWTLPAGWSYFTDGSGFHIAVPDDWTYQRIGTTYCFRNARNSRVLSLDVGLDATADPVRTLQAEERRLAGPNGLPGYTKVDLKPVALLHRAADWEYRYRSRSGTARHTVLRWFVVDGRAYALGWTTVEKAWTADLGKIQMIRGTFFTVGSTRGPLPSAS